jgi:hypothetical protein
MASSPIKFMQRNCVGQKASTVTRGAEFAVSGGHEVAQAVCVSQLLCALASAQQGRLYKGSC